MFALQTFIFFFFFHISVSRWSAIDSHTQNININNINVEVIKSEFELGLLMLWQLNYYFCPKMKKTKKQNCIFSLSRHSISIQKFYNLLFLVDFAQSNSPPHFSSSPCSVSESSESFVNFYERNCRLVHTSLPTGKYKNKHI